MTMVCETVQARLAESGRHAAETDTVLRAHLDQCRDCSRFLDALGRVDAGMGALPRHDAPQRLVNETLDAVAHAGPPGAQPGSGRAWSERWASGLAAAAVVLAAFGLLYPTMQQTALRSTELAVVTGTQDKLAPVDEVPGLDFDDSSALANRRENEEAEMPEFEVALEPAPEPAAPMAYFSMGSAAEELPETVAPAEVASAPQLVARPRQRRAETSDKPSKQERPAIVGEEVVDQELSRSELEPAERHAYASRALSAPKTAPRPPMEDARAAGVSALIGGFGSLAEGDDRRGRRLEADAMRTDGGLSGKGSKRDNGRASAVTEYPRRQLVSPMPPPAPKDENKTAAPTSDAGPPPPDEARLAARRFLAERRTWEGLGFQAPTGYWANTYVPGDPTIRLLRARLSAWDRRGLGAHAAALSLERAARQNWQPFDAPRDAALALYLHADQRAVEEPARLLLQVGLQAARRHGGTRPAMNVALVVDMRQRLEPGTAAAVRALVMALEQARQPADKFSLRVAGRAGGLVVAPEAFRYGPLHVALARLLAESPDSKGPAVGLYDSVAAAAASLRKGNDLSATLGTNLVLLIATAPVGADLSRLERLAHTNALAGVSLSAVALGKTVDLNEMDRLVRAGQGNRRILETPAEAERLVDRELHAASRAVARAVRLRIRLAPGVKLVEVLGSRRLDDPAAERVRQAERSIDQRVARNLGIRADRGEDEEGIQIVIPHFYAGGAHVVLLDVVADGPGPLADVTARFKDLVHLRNGVARARLALGRGTGQGTPLERNVLKNFLAWRLSETAREASEQLAAQDLEGALARVRAIANLYAGLRAEVPGWSGDRELLADEAMLKEYLAVLESPAAGPRQRHRLADSLAYTAFRKQLTESR